VFDTQVNQASNRVWRDRLGSQGGSIAWALALWLAFLVSVPAAQIWPSIKFKLIRAVNADRGNCPFGFHRGFFFYPFQSKNEASLMMLGIVSPEIIDTSENKWIRSRAIFDTSNQIRSMSLVNSFGWTTFPKWHVNTRFFFSREQRHASIILCSSLSEHRSACCLLPCYGVALFRIANVIGEVGEYIDSGGNRVPIIFQAKPDRTIHAVRIRKIQVKQRCLYRYRWTISESKLGFCGSVQTVSDRRVDTQKDEGNPFKTVLLYFEGSALLLLGIGLIGWGWWHVCFDPSAMGWFGLIIVFLAWLPLGYGFFILFMQ